MLASSPQIGYFATRMEAQILRLAKDARGMVYEPLKPGELPLQRNAHIVFTRPGGVRANHYHVHGTEILTVMGPALVRFREGGAIRDFNVAEEQVMRFTIPPGVAHAVLNTGKTTGVIAAFNTSPHDPAKPDVIQDILIPTAVEGR